MRLSVTHLDAYRLYLDPEVEWMDEATLVAQIRGTAPMSPKAALGIAFHKALECGHCLVDDISFDPALLKRVRDRDMGHPVVSEVKLEKDLTIDGKDVTLVGKVDSMRGLVGREIKTTQSSIDVERYYEAIQWRAYLYLGGLDRMDYSIFQLREDNGVWHCTNEANVSFWPYSNLERDVIEAVRGFLSWADGRDLERVSA